MKKSKSYYNNRSYHLAHYGKNRRIRKKNMKKIMAWVDFSKYLDMSMPNIRRINNE